jgi:hypothetical protein
LLLLIMSPMVALASVLYLRQRRATVVRTATAALASVAECELKARFLLESDVVLAVRAAALNNIAMRLNASERRLHAELIADADAVLAFAVRRFPTASALVTRAHYQFALAAAYRHLDDGSTGSSGSGSGSGSRSVQVALVDAISAAQGMFSLSKAEQRAPSFADAFVVFSYRKAAELEFSADESRVTAAVRNYIHFQTGLADVRVADEEASTFQVRPYGWPFVFRFVRVHFGPPGWNHFSVSDPTVPVV